MIEITQGIFVGDESNCIYQNNTSWAVVHACKFPCHRNAVGYKYKLPPSHPNYLIYKRNSDLYLNMVDMDKELLPEYTNPIMKAAIEFIYEMKNTLNVLIHCNKGQSRSPSIGMIYLAKNKIISNGSYNDAFKEFMIVYPTYEPGLGITLYLKSNWNYLMNF